MPDSDKNYLSLLVRDTPGVLQRVSGLFSRRSYNIDSVTVGGCEKSSFSRAIVAVQGDEQRMAQIGSQLNKLIDVVEVNRFGAASAIARELMLVRLSPPAEKRAELQSLLDLFRFPIIETAVDSLIVQVTGDKEKNDAFLAMIARYGIMEIVRTGETALARL
jgi:acetolactate synthase, small subunit